MADLPANHQRAPVSVAPSWRRGLSARLLVLTIAFVMLSEVLIYMPSIARFRQDFMVQKLVEANLATLAVLAAPNSEVSADLEAELLRTLGVRGVALKRPDTRYFMLSDRMPPKVDATFDMRDPSPLTLLKDSFEALFTPGNRIIRVIGEVSRGPATQIEVIFDETPLKSAMYDFSGRILTLSIIISLITAGLVFFSLQWLLVRPMERITESMIRFRQNPEDASRVIVPSDRSDEIGIAQKELAAMQRDLRDALRQKTRLAALGTAVSKINHDLRNVLAVAQLVSDRLAANPDPEVQRLTPRLIVALDRAINLCSRTLRFGRADEPPPDIGPLALRELVEEVGAAVVQPDEAGVRWQNDVPADFVVWADSDQLFRVLLNLGRNATQAMAGRDGAIRIAARRDNGASVIDIGDDGPGLPPVAREHLFEAFTGSARAGGTGLGLAIARDLVRAHGGDIQLLDSGPGGTTFRIVLPGPAKA